jgi:hypothetical protein
MRAQPIGNSTGVALETVERHLRILADLDEVAVGITHAAMPFPAVMVQLLGKKERSFVAPLFVTGPDVGDAQVKEAIHPVKIRRGLSGLPGVGPAPELRMIQVLASLMYQGFSGLITFPPGIRT